VAAPAAGRANHGNSSPALSQVNLATPTLRGRKVAVLAADGVDAGTIALLRKALADGGAVAEVLAATDGQLSTLDGEPLAVDRAAVTMAAALYDGVFVPDAAAGLGTDGLSLGYLLDAYRQGKPIGAVGTGVAVLQAAGLPAAADQDGAGPARDEHGIVTGAGEAVVATFVERLAGPRDFTRDISAVPG
jgi:catalase